jgi:leader peptidase (prepilin peptidase)/N-methyltransferase
MTAFDAVAIVFLFSLGACLGSFLNVVVWRLPRGESLVTPPSHCPKCNNRLKWYDNIPVIGWIKLGGRCRFCHEPISKRYPVVEAVTGALFVFYYVMFFVLKVGPCPPVARPAAFTPLVPPPALLFARDWPIYGLYMFLACGLLAASLIDAELFVIPAEIPWLIAAVALLFHALIDHPRLPGALNLVDAAGAPTIANALAAGGAAGLLISIGLWLAGVMPTSFPQGDPILEVDRAEFETEAARARKEGRTPDPLPPPYTKGQIRTEIGKEALFLLPPIVLAFAWLVLTRHVGSIADAWSSATHHDWVTALLGAIFGALIGAFVVWITRILGTLGFGRVAMGLGDVHLMFGVGAVVGAGAATVAFFLAPFFGIILAVYLLITGTRRELPYGPYLSLATGFVLLFYCPIAAYMAPGLSAIGYYLGIPGTGG